MPGIVQLDDEGGTYAMRNQLQTALKSLRRFDLLLFILPLILISGCHKTSTPAPAPTQSASANVPLDQLNHAGAVVATAPETKYFKGSIGNSLDLQMRLVKTGDQINGSYFYEKVGAKINLRGTVDKDGNLSLDEFDSAGKQTGVFKGIWKPEPEDGLITIAGLWSKPPNEKGSDKRTAFSLHEEPISLSGYSELTTKQIKENNKKLHYEIEARYPQLEGVNNLNFDKFNQAARGLVQKQVTGFKKNLEAPQREGEELPPEEITASTIGIDYVVSLLQDDLASVRFDTASYYNGAAHPNTETEVLNFDLKNGKPVKLSDLFKPGAKFLQPISTYAISDLKKQSKAKGADGMLDDSSIESGAAPKAENYRSWMIKKNGLGINFDAYQVGPYAAGPQYVLVPYSILKDLINPEGPIAQFAK